VFSGRCPSITTPTNLDAAGWGTFTCKIPLHLYGFEI
jgi:hypothetical protein